MKHVTGGFAQEGGSVGCSLTCHAKANNREIVVTWDQSCTTTTVNGSTYAVFGSLAVGCADMNLNN